MDKNEQDYTENSILELADRLVSVSDFSKGKTAQIFEDIRNNKHEYIVLKNNQPMAVMLSIESYRELVGRARKVNAMLERIETSRFSKRTSRVSVAFETPAAAESVSRAPEEIHTPVAAPDPIGPEKIEAYDHEPADNDNTREETDSRP